VVDAFGGSGTTMVASHNLKRNCYMMEMDKHYCQLIIDRMLKLFPGIQVLKNGEAYQAA
jgi:DNA modification methylase